MLSERTRIADWVLLLVRLPGLPAKPAGILLLDPAHDRLHIALANAVSRDEDIREVWDSLPEELAARASESGGSRLLHLLEKDLSMFLQIQPRQRIATADPEKTLKALFQKHVLNASAAAQSD